MLTVIKFRGLNVRCDRGVIRCPYFREDISLLFLPTEDGAASDVDKDKERSFFEKQHHQLKQAV